MSKSKFPLEVVSTNGIIFQEDVESVYLFGTEGEFELLPYHFPLVASLAPSEIKIEGNDPLPIQSGVVMFADNRCTIVAEMQTGFKGLKKAWY